MDEQEVTVGIWPMTRSLEQSRWAGGGRLAVPCDGGVSDPARKTWHQRKIPSSARLAIGCMTAQEAPHVQ